MDNQLIADMREIRDRVRRTETRVTKIGHALNIDVGGGRPTWDDGNIRLPSPNCSISDVVKSIPDDFAGKLVRVFVGDDLLTTLTPQGYLPR